MKNQKIPQKPLHFLRTTNNQSDKKGVKINSNKVQIDVVASKKEFKNAIRRNKARRRIKEAYRTIAKPNKPYLKINAKIGSLDTKFEELKNIITKEIDNDKR